jgi:L-lactate utilization protein LutB
MSNAHNTIKTLNPVIEKVIDSLKKRKITGLAAEDAAHARKLIFDVVPEGAVIGTGDSSSVRQIQAVKVLEERGNRVINGFDPDKKIHDLKSHFENGFWPMLEATVCDVFLTGSNAITEDGHIINVDGNGNRIAGMIWGHPITILVLGKNKIVKNLDEGLVRVKNVIAPEHLKRKGAPSPCTKSGYCHDCIGPHRACAVTSIIESSPPHTKIHVILVDEDLGLSWDRSWPEERINRIIRQHEEHMVMCPMPECVFEKGNNDKLWKMARQKRRGNVWP